MSNAISHFRKGASIALVAIMVIAGSSFAFKTKVPSSTLDDLAFISPLLRVTDTVADTQFALAPIPNIASINSMLAELGPAWSVAMELRTGRPTLIAGGAQWSDVGQLEKIEVVADRNVVYNFHCYEPFKFTHQQATWAGDSVRGLKNAPYPSSPEAVAKVLPDLPDEKARQNMTQYGKENWNAEKIDALIARAAAWGKKNGVPLTCNEFGVYRKAPAADRGRCIEDVRKACEKYNIGWAMWDYAGGFAVATGKPGERVADADTVKALGLTAPK